MSTAAWVGVGMAVTGLVLVIFELVLALPRLLRLTKRLKELNLLLEDNLRLTYDELQILHQARSETSLLLGPFRKLGRWLGHPLEEPLRFALRPFSDELEEIWRRTLSYLWSSEEHGLPLGAAAKSALDEYLLTLLLHHHPHNYSDEMARDTSAPVPGIVRRAERFMADNADTPVTVSDVAAHLGVSLRSLQAGFRQWRNATPNAYLRQVRLQLVREELLRSDKDASVTTIALQHGFMHLGRFSAQYRAAFGEGPSATLRRGRAASISSQRVRAVRGSR